MLNVANIAQYTAVDIIMLIGLAPVLAILYKYDNRGWRLSIFAFPPLLNTTHSILQSNASFQFPVGLAVPYKNYFLKFLPIWNLQFNDYGTKQISVWEF